MKSSTLGKHSLSQLFYRWIAHEARATIESHSKEAKRDWISVARMSILYSLTKFSKMKPNERTERLRFLARAIDGMNSMSDASPKALKDATDEYNALLSEDMEETLGAHIIIGPGGKKSLSLEPSTKGFHDEGEE